MYWILIILIIVIGIYIIFNNDRKEIIDKQVTSNGGMLVKYNILITWITRDPSAKIINLKSDSLDIISTGHTTSVKFFITETFGKVNIRWEANYGQVLGKHTNSWNYPHDYPQENIIEDIGQHMHYVARKIGLI